MQRKLEKNRKDKIIEDLDSDGEVLEAVTDSDSDMDAGTPEFSSDDEGRNFRRVKSAKKGKKKQGNGPSEAPAVGGKVKTRKHATHHTKSGYNWYAISILVLFLAVPIFTGVQYLIDYMDPKGAVNRKIHAKVFRCLNAVGDEEMLRDINRLLNKYKGKEKVLYRKLGAKHGEEHPECLGGLF